MSLAESPPTGLATYVFRQSVFHDERHYVLFPDRIEVREGDYLRLALPLHAIRKVHLRYDPSETRAYYKCNIRAAGTDENLILTPPIRHSLEQAMEFIDTDELVEITPTSIRIRKMYLTENERRRMSKKSASTETE